MNAGERVQETAQSMLTEGVIVAIRLTDGSALAEIGRALAAGGLNVLEMTLTTPRALEAIHELAGDSGILVGGGTVLSADDVHAVADAGGRFALSPVFDPGVLDASAERGLLAIPGASTPKEILTAHQHGARFVKVFPAKPLGGAEYLRLVRGPLPDVPLIPTSGPTADTLGQYLDAGAVAVGVGGMELFPPGFTLDDVEAAARRVRQAVDAWRAANRTN
jgi:2-dehydro-3-deoxyphosphogluconate aldolase/(4S)-4-hydroxy-2-oxoglutarate aldolase